MNQNCPCKKTHCARHGDCEACRAHHAAAKRQIPVACETKKPTTAPGKNRPAPPTPAGK